MSPTLPGRFAALRLAFACAFLIVTCHCGSLAAPDTVTHPSEALLFVGHLNFDCIPDSVVGWADSFGHFLPHAIRWGRPRMIIRRDSMAAVIDTLYPDSACMGTIPPARRVAVTAIHYPGWDRFSGSVAFQRMNPDSLSDMLLYIWGTVGDSTERHDTLRPILLFGQQGLDTLGEIDIAAIGSFQAVPFFAMELRKGSELVDPAVRDISGVVSYALAPVALSFGERDRDSSGDIAPLPGDSLPSPAIHLRVYPNPASNTARLEVDSLPPGDYQADIVAVNGLVYLSQSVTVSLSGSGESPLDVHMLPVGFYVLRIRQGDQVYGIYPIIITR